VDLGPDLTHVYSRLTIAGASLTNNRGNLAGWIVDAQHVKPGSLMPNMYLESEDLQALLAYLETLH
jgi:cytochrome c oxidase subunit 2